MILLKAIADNKGLLHGTDLDWGSGVGCQAILAAKIDAVDIVYGLDISKNNVNAAVQNAKRNKVDRKTRFILADSYELIDDADRKEIQALRGKVDFIVSNPPSNNRDNGFGYRSIVLSGDRYF
jgi:methylase of polypeptide subunit release factors